LVDIILTGKKLLKKTLHQQKVQCNHWHNTSYLRACGWEWANIIGYIHWLKWYTWTLELCM